MKVSTEKPPIWEEASKAFNLDPGRATFFTYGDTIYNPANYPLSADLIRHEETHGEQQEHHPDVAAIWWKRYLQDPEFRLDQETEAYAEQYKFYCQQEKRRDMRARYLFEIAGHLSSPMYGSIISRAQAMRRIREYAEMGIKPVAGVVE